MKGAALSRKVSRSSVDSPFAKVAASLRESILHETVRGRTSPAARFGMMWMRFLAICLESIAFNFQPHDSSLERTDSALRARTLIIGNREEPIILLP